MSLQIATLRSPSGLDSPTRAAAGTARRVPVLSLPLALALASAQFLLLVGLSLLQWHRFALTYDFSLYGQAAWLIAHGHLDPTLSVNGLPFLRNNAELIFWPIALLSVPFGGSPLVLALVQDAALAAAGAASLAWMGEILERHASVPPGTRRSLSWLAVAAVLADPWCYQTALFDFHTEAIAGLFSVLAVRALWRRTPRAFVVFSALVVATGVAGTIEGIGIAVSAALCWRQARALAGGVGVVAAGWLAAQVAFGLAAQSGGTIADSTGFGYLDPGHAHPGLAGLAVGALTHLPAIARLVFPRLPVALVLLAPVGLVGALDALAIGPVLAVFGPAMMARSPIFFRTAAAFQVWPVLLVVAACSLERCCRRLVARAGMFARSGDERAGPSFKVAAACFLAGLTAIATTVIARLPSTWLAVSRPAAATLASISGRIPPGAEVVASQGIAGRFAGRSEVVPLMSPRQRVPVREATVVFVLAPRQGVLQISPAATAAILCSVRSLSKSRLLASGGGVTAVAWRPPPKTTSLVLPAGAAGGSQR